MTPIRLLIIDDHPVLREGLKTLLQTWSQMNTIAEAATGEQAMVLVETFHPDILILDANLPDCDGVEIAEALYKAKNSVKILVLSAYDDLEHVRRFRAAGVAGYLLKDEAYEFLIEAMEAVTRGETGWLSPRIQQQLSQIVNQRAIIQT